MVGKDGGQGLPKHFGQHDHADAGDAEPGQAQVAAAQQADDRQVGEGRELPDVFLIRREIAKQAAHHAGGGEQQHGQGLALEQGRDRDEDAGHQTGDVAPEHPHHQAAFHPQVDGLIAPGGVPTRTATPAP